jgi:DNA-dependent protein kinase catalytic subunit
MMGDSTRFVPTSTLATSAADISDLKRWLRLFSTFSRNGMNESGTAPKTMVHSIFSLCRSRRVKSSKSLLATVTSLIFQSNDPPNILLSLEKMSIRCYAGKDVAAETESCVEALQQLSSLIKEEGVKPLKLYLTRLQKICYGMLSREKRKPVQYQAFFPLFEILETSPRETSRSERPWIDAHSMGLTERMNNNGRTTRPFYECVSDLQGKTAKAYGKVKGVALEMLGRLLYVYPRELKELSGSILNTLADSLKTAYAKTSNQKANVIAGAISGMHFALYACTDGSVEGFRPRKTKEVYNSIFVQAMEVPEDMNRFRVPVTAMKFIAAHSNYFQKCIVEDGISIFRRLLSCFLSDSPTVANAVPGALRAVVRVLGQFIQSSPTDGAENEEQKKQLFSEVIEPLKAFLNHNDRRYRDFATHMIGDFAGAIHKYWKTQELKNIVTFLLDRYSSIANSTIGKGSSGQNAGSHILLYKVGAGQLSLLCACGNIMSLLPTREIDVGMSDALNTVLKNIMGTYHSVWSNRKLKQKLSFSRYLVQLLRGLEHNTEAHAVVLNAIVMNGLDRAMDHPQLLAETAERPQAMPVIYSELFSLVVSEAGQLHGDRDVDMESSGSQKSQDAPQNICNRLMECMLEIISRLNLRLFVNDGEEETDSAEVNPEESQEDEGENTDINNYMLRQTNQFPANPHDFGRFLNLVKFFVSFYSGNDEYAKLLARCSSNWILTVLENLIPVSERNPEISGFYKLFKIFFDICNGIGFFKGCKQNGNGTHRKQQVFDQLFHYVKVVQIRSRQYQDELFVASANMILNAPIELMNLHIQTPVLLSALTTGRSYRPIAWVAMRALEHWRNALPLDELKVYLPEILPKLNNYLSNRMEEDTGDSEASRGAQTLHSCVLQFLGRIGGLGHGVVGSSATHLAEGLRWNSSHQVQVTFHLDGDTTINLPLDDLLPQIMELSESGAGDSKSKLPACETLHAIILYMLPMQNQEHLCKIYRELFPCILRLSTDTHDITRNMFEPLVKQLVHWFSKKKASNRMGIKSTAPETVVWLDCIVEGASNGSNAALKDVSTRALAEFLKWAIKQSVSVSAPRSRRKKGHARPPRSSPVEIDSLMRRLFNMLKSQNPDKQMGAAMTLNLMYRDFREELTLVSKYTLDTLYYVMFALKYAGRKLINGVASVNFEAGAELHKSILHFQRIVCDDAMVRNSAVEYKGKIVKNIDDLMDKLFEATCNREHSAYRQTAASLFESIAIARFGGCRKWHDRSIKKRRISVVKIFENDLLMQSTLYGIRETKKWIDSFHGCLFSFAWALKLKMCDPTAAFQKTGNPVQDGQRPKRKPVDSAGLRHTENDVHLLGGQDKMAGSAVTRASVFRYFYRAVMKKTVFSDRLLIDILQFTKEVILAVHSVPGMCAKRLFLSPANTEHDQNIFISLLSNLITQAMFSPHKFACRSAKAFKELQHTSYEAIAAVVDTVRPPSNSYFSKLSLSHDE